MMPNRDELRSQLESQLTEARTIVDRPPWEDKEDRITRTVARYSRSPAWKDLPAAFYRAEFSEFRQTVASVRLATTRLLIALEQHRRATGDWPESLVEFSDLIPRDPYADRHVQYRVEAGVPTIWSVGADGADDGGTKLGTSSARSDDWQLVPQQDRTYLDWVRENRQ